MTTKVNNGPATDTDSQGFPEVKFQVPGGSGDGTAYGLTSSAAGAQFDLTGLPGLGSGNATGTDLLGAFVAAGSGRGDPAIVAAIQQALLLGGYYTSTYTPIPGRVRPEDAKAFAQALNQLSVANGATPQGGGVPTLGVAQFLTQSAALGAASGQAGAQQKQALVVHKPDPTAVAAAFERIAEQEEGRRPSAGETQQFVSEYIAKYEQRQRDNYSAQTGAAPADASTLPLSPPPTLPHGITAVDPNTLTSPEVFNQGPPGLDVSMQSLSDVLSNPDTGIPTVEQVDAPDLTAEAENFVRMQHPGAVARNDLGNTLDMFLNILASNGGA